MLLERGKSPVPAQLHIPLSQRTGMDLRPARTNVFIKIPAGRAVTNLPLRARWLRFNFILDYGQLHLQSSQGWAHSAWKWTSLPKVLKQLWIRNDGLGKIRSTRKISRLRGEPGGNAQGLRLPNCLGDLGENSEGGGFTDSQIYGDECRVCL